jgi:hypothetical protein
VLANVVPEMTTITHCLEVINPRAIRLSAEVRRREHNDSVCKLGPSPVELDAPPAAVQTTLAGTLTLFAAGRVAGSLEDPPAELRPFRRVSLRAHGTHLSNAKPQYGQNFGITFVDSNASEVSSGAVAIVTIAKAFEHARHVQGSTVAQSFGDTSIALRAITLTFVPYAGAIGRPRRRRRPGAELGVPA